MEKNIFIIALVCILAVLLLLFFLYKKRNNNGNIRNNIGKFKKNKNIQYHIYEDKEQTLTCKEGVLKFGDVYFGPLGCPGCDYSTKADDLTESLKKTFDGQKFARVIVGSSSNPKDKKCPDESCKYGIRGTYECVV